MHQSLAVTVAGAALTSSPADVTVVLHRQGQSSRFVGPFGPLTVVDARGTLAGWTLFVSPVGQLPPGTVGVHPGAPVTVSGNAWEVRALNPSKLGPSQAAVMTAPAGGGGGTFSDSGTVVVDSPSASGDSLTLRLAVSAGDARPTPAGKMGRCRRTFSTCATPT